MNRHRPVARQWFHTAADFVHNTNTGATRPFSKPLSDPYWSSPALATHENLAFDEWKKRIFSGSSAAGGGPVVLLDSRISGATAAASLPYTAALSLDTARISWSGLDRGAANQNDGGSAIGSDGRGVRIDADTNALRFAVSQGAASQENSTLASAITDNEFFKFTIRPVSGRPLDLCNARVDFTWERTEYHSPRSLAVFTSIGGFTAGQQVYTLATTPNAGCMVTTSFYLPETAAYQNVTAPVEFRILLHGSQYSHTARVHGIKITRDLELTSTGG